MKSLLSDGLAKRALLVVLVALVAAAGLTACGPRKEASKASFVGKWKSSKLETPLVLYENGEWEIKPDAGGVLQYGIWEYRDGNIIWRIKSGSQVVTDVNPLVSVTAQEFRLREGAQVTVFTRLN
jgi:hypothetical protein